MRSDGNVLFDLKKAADALSALSNSHRYSLIRLIAENELDVGTLVERVGASQSSVSQHLSRLRAMKLVNTRRDRQNIYYSATDEAKLLLEAIDEALAPLS